MANTHNSKAKVGQKSKKMEEKKVVPLGLAGIRTRDLWIMRPPLYQLSYFDQKLSRAKNMCIYLKMKFLVKMAQIKLQTQISQGSIDRFFTFDAF